MGSQIQALLQFQQQQQQAIAAATTAAPAVQWNQTMPHNGENWIMAEAEAASTTDPATSICPLFNSASTEGEIRTWIRHAFLTMTTQNNVTTHDAAMYLVAQAQQSNTEAWLRDQVVSVVQDELRIIGLAPTPPA